MALFADSPQPHSEKEVLLYSSTGFLAKNASIQEPSRIKTMAQDLLRWYTSVVSDWKVALAVILVWTLYVGGAIVVGRVIL